MKSFIKTKVKRIQLKLKLRGEIIFQNSHGGCIPDDFFLLQDTKNIGENFPVTRFIILLRITERIKLFRTALIN